MKKFFLAISLISLFGIKIIESQQCKTNADCGNGFCQLDSLTCFDTSENF